MNAEHKIVSDFFGEDHFLTRRGPVLKETMVGVVMDHTKEIMEIYCEEWPDEEIVFIDCFSDISLDLVNAPDHVVGEWGYLANGEYILLSRVDGSRSLLGKQLMMIKEKNLPAKVFRISVDDFASGHGFDFESSVDDVDNGIALHELAREIARTILMEEDNGRAVLISPEELVKEFPLKLTI